MRWSEVEERIRGSGKGCVGGEGFRRSNRRLLKVRVGGEGWIESGRKWLRREEISEYTSLHFYMPFECLCLPLPNP